MHITIPDDDEYCVVICVNADACRRAKLTAAVIEWTVMILIRVLSFGLRTETERRA